MSKSSADIVSCLEVTEAMVDAALRPAESMTESSPRERVFELLRKMAHVARPRQGAAKILLVLARVARCAWLDGDLELRLVAADGGTSLEVFVNDGLSLQKLPGTLAIGAPFEEFRRAVHQKPHLVAPLEVTGHLGATKMRLIAAQGSASQDAPKALATLPPRRTRRPPPAETATMIGRVALRRIAVPAGDVVKRASRKPPPADRAPPSSGRSHTRDEERVQTPTTPTRHPSARKQTSVPRQKGIVPPPPKTPRDPTGRR